jgi:peptidoglycan/LPS O-acetylase OafA/YrhL
VPARAVAAVAAQGTRIVTASSVAVLAVAAVSAPLLLATATLPLDRVGARFLVALAGGALLLAARSYRHAVARALLRAAGLACWAALLVALLRMVGDRSGTTVAATAILLACLMILVAVATGRGWRSAWWSRRAEVAEGLCGSFAVASVFVAVGLFRSLWEMTS